jgi:hypothetical protein
MMIDIETIIAAERERLQTDLGARLLRFAEKGFRR